MYLKDRLRQHDRRQTKTTAKKAPYLLAWFCGFNNKQMAYQFERYLKSSSGFAFRNKHLI